MSGALYVRHIVFIRFAARLLSLQACSKAPDWTALARGLLSLRTCWCRPECYAHVDDGDEEVPVPALFMPPAPKDRPYQCPHGCCGKKYTSQQTLADHCRIYHSVTSSRCRRREDGAGRRDSEREEERRARRAAHTREMRQMRPSLQRDTLRGLTLSSPLLECAT